MKTSKVLVLGLCTVILLGIFTPFVNAYLFKGTLGEMDMTGREQYQRTFYSNYSNKFYMIFDYDDIFHGLGIVYSYSDYGITWSPAIYLWNRSEDAVAWHVHMGLKNFDFYVEPDGRYIHFANHTGSTGWYWKMEINQTTGIITPITNEPQMFIQGTYGSSWYLKDEISITVDSNGYPYIGAEIQSGAQLCYSVWKSAMNNGTWLLEDFDDFWYIKSEYMANGGANPGSNGMGGELHPSYDDNIVLIWWFYEQPDGRQMHKSMYYDASADDWINCAGGIFNDNEGGDWAEHCWSTGYSLQANKSVIFKQKESLPNGLIGISGIVLDHTTYTWGSSFQVSFNEVGDAGSTVFNPFVTMSNSGAINFVWTIAGNNTYWARRMYSNGTLESDWFIVENMYNDMIEDNQFSVADTAPVYTPMPMLMMDDIGGNLDQDYIYFNYLTFLEGNWSIPFEYYNSTLYNSDGSLNDGWIFRGETYKVESYFRNASTFTLSFTDGEHDIEFEYNNATQRLSINSDDQFIIGDYYFNITHYTSGITKATWGFIPNTNIVDISNTTIYYSLYYEPTDSTLSADTGMTFNIYNLGGYTYYTFTGDGGRTIGGTPFQLHATNGTLNSTARAEQVFRKLQHVSFLMELDMSNVWDSGNGEFDIDAGIGYVDIGIDYRLNSSWVEGFKIRMYVQSADVGHHDGGVDHNWVEWSVDFYNYDPDTGLSQNLKSELIYTNHWGYEHENYVPDYHNRTSSQFWIDLWFDRANASTTVGAQVNAYYHGMKEQGSSWWFGYGDFTPMISNYDNAKFLDDLYDEGGNITNIQKYDLMRFYIEIGKVDIPDGNDQTWTVRGIEDMHREQAIDRMEGIDEPTFVATKVLDMPQGGFINALKSALSNIANSITQGIFFTMKSVWSGVGWVAELMGLGAWFDSLSIMIGNVATASLAFMDQLQVALLNSALLIEQITRVISSGIVRYTFVLTQFISSILLWYQYIIDIFSGGGLWSINIWTSLNLGDFFMLGMHLFPVYWLNRLNEADDTIGTLQGDLRFIIMLVTGLFSFLSSVIIVTMTLINILLGMLPI